MGQGRSIGGRLPTHPHPPLLFPHPQRASSMPAASAETVLGEGELRAQEDMGVSLGVITEGVLLRGVSLGGITEGVSLRRVASNRASSMPAASAEKVLAFLGAFASTPNGSNASFVSSAPYLMGGCVVYNRSYLLSSAHATCSAVWASRFLSGRQYH